MKLTLIARNNINKILSFFGYKLIRNNPFYSSKSPFDLFSLLLNSFLYETDQKTVSILIADIKPNAYSLMFHQTDFSKINIELFVISPGTSSELTKGSYLGPISIAASNTPLFKRDIIKKKLSDTKRQPLDSIGLVLKANKLNSDVLFIGKDLKEYHFLINLFKSKVYPCIIVINYSMHTRSGSKELAFLLLDNGYRFSYSNSYIYCRRYF